MSFYFPERIKIKSKSYFRRLVKPAKAILYISIPIASIYAFFKYLEVHYEKLDLLLGNKIVIILFIIFFSIPIAVCFIWFLYYLFKIVFLFVRDIINIVRTYKKLRNAWFSEAFKNNNVYIPELKITTYNYFKQEFKNESKILRLIYFDVEDIINFPTGENWNIKIALGENRDIFYVIYHTKVGDSRKLINVAIENKDLGDDQQLNTVTRYTSNEIRMHLLKLYISDCNDKGYKEVWYSIGENRIKVADRKEKIRIENLHNLRLEIWASNAIRGNKAFVDAKLKNIWISWE